MKVRVSYDGSRRLARAGTAPLPLPLLLVLLLLLWPVSAPALKLVPAYSPRNRERPLRRQTRHIILHTTEAPFRGSLAKLKRNGEAHYLVDESGCVYRIIHRNRVAYHAGRSMWNGRTGLDAFSIGIEVVGYHNRDIGALQRRALSELLDELQRIYGIADENVLTHSMVAYGAPNRWHRRSHRGRKRCGMLFARRSLRLKLGLQRQPLRDPDVDAGRLVVADPLLAAALYGTAAEQEVAAACFKTEEANVIARGRSAWDIARDQYNSADTLYHFPDGSVMRGSQISNWKSMPAGTRVVMADNQRDNESELVQTIGEQGPSAREIAGEEYDRKTTIYFLKDGRVRDGSELDGKVLDKLPEGTRMLVGYVNGGYITARRSAFDVCGPRWNSPATFYRFSDGRILSGSEVRENRIPRGTQVFFQH